MGSRCYLPTESWGSREIRLSGREAHHLTRVLRVHQGDSVTCFDGQGNEADAIVTGLNGREILLRMGQLHRASDCAWDISLGVAVPGQGKLEEIVNQATQLGARRIIPLLTQRTVARLTSEQFSRKVVHLRQIAIEALKQCGLGRLPDLQAVTPWKDFLKSFPLYDLILMATVEGPHEGFKELVIHRRPQRLLVLVGPEGDFSPEEIQQAVQTGAHRVSLGPSVLRCETAVVVALSVASFLLREHASPP